MIASYALESEDFKYLNPPKSGFLLCYFLHTESTRIQTSMPPQLEDPPPRVDNFSFHIRVLITSRINIYASRTGDEGASFNWDALLPTFAYNLDAFYSPPPSGSGSLHPAQYDLVTIRLYMSQQTRSRRVWAHNLEDRNPTRTNTWWKASETELSFLSLYTTGVKEETFSPLAKGDRILRSWKWGF